MAITTAKQAADILNQTLVSLGYATGDTIDTTDGDTIEAGIKAIGAYPPSMRRNIIEQVVTILKFNNFMTMFTASKNPTRVFWRDAIKNGGGLEDIYHKILEAETFSYTAEDYAQYDEESQDYIDLANAHARHLVSYRKPDVVKKFHTNIKGFRFKLSRSDYETSLLFTTEGFTSFVDVQMANLQASAEVEMQKVVIENCVGMINDGACIFMDGYSLNNHNGVTEFVEAVKTVTDGMTENVSDAYNKEGILTMSNKEDLFLITTPAVINRIATRGNANAFNLSEYKNNNRVLLFPNGTDLGTAPSGNKVHALLIDRRAIVMAIRYWETAPFYPSDTNFVNYFLKAQYVAGYNEFFNAVAFAGDELSGYSISDEKVILVAENDMVGIDLFVDGVKLTKKYDGTNSYSAFVPKGALIEANITGETGKILTISIGGIILQEVEVGASQAVEFYATDYTNIDLAEEEP